jgi:hypothetical protein
MDFVPGSASGSVVHSAKNRSHFTNVRLMGKDNCRSLKREFLAWVTIVSQEIVFPSFLALLIVDQLFPLEPPLESPL